MAKKEITNYDKLTILAGLDPMILVEALFRGVILHDTFGDTKLAASKVSLDKKGLYYVAVSRDGKSRRVHLRPKQYKTGWSVATKTKN